MIFAELQTLAKKNNNYVATGASFSNSTTLHKIVCPTGKRWFLLGGYVFRDASATIIVTIRDSTGANIQKVLDEAAGTGGTVYPEAVFQTGVIVLDAAEWIQMDFGAAQGGGAYVSGIVLEVNV